MRRGLVRYLLGGLGWLGDVARLRGVAAGGVLGGLLVLAAPVVVLTDAIAQRAGGASGAASGGQLGPRSVAPVAEKLIEAVVNISTTQVSKSGEGGVPLPSVPEGSPFEEFFEDFFNKRGDGVVPHRKVSSLGSGFVIDGEKGLVVTNNHVIADADEIVVNFSDGSKLTVDKVLGVDAKSDLALLKVTPVKRLADVGFGRSKDLRVGDWVMAIGNPFGLGGSVTVGVISAKQRDIKSGPYDEYLQTDASINKGNSGGPLFNMDGDVIGINTAIISPTGGSIGIGFAVPSDTAVSVLGQLEKHGEVRRGWLGVKIQTVTEEIAESLGVDPNTGALVSAVEPSSPADKGGIQPGDVITTFNGEAVSKMRGLPRIVARTGVGETVDVEGLRKGKKKSFKVTVGRLRDGGLERVDAEENSGDEDALTGMPGVILGMRLVPIDDALRKKFRLGDEASGLVVVEVEPDGAAVKRDIAVGNLIVEAAQEPVKDVGDIKRNIEKMRKAGRAAILLRVEDASGELRFVAVPIR